MPIITRTPAVPLSVLQAGEEGADRVVVLVHGVLDSAACWMPVMEDLAADGHRVVAVDLPGHGMSPAPEREFSVPAMAEAVHQTIGSLGIGRFHLVGHSLGGLVCQQLALSHPQSVLSLVLEDPAWGVAGSSPTEAPAFLLERAEQLRTWTPRQILDDGRRAHPEWDERDIAGWFEAKADVRLELFDLEQEWVGRTGAGSWTGYAGAVRVITGGRDDAIVSPAMVSEAAAASEAVTHDHVAEAGHNIRKDAPERFMRILTEFLGCQVRKAGQ
jgi:lipase